MRTPLRALLVLAVALTGCFRSDITVAVDDDGSGTVSAIVAIDPSAYERMVRQFGGADGEDGLGADPCEALRDEVESPGALPPGARVAPYSDGRFCGVRVVLPFAAGDDVTEAIRQAVGGSDGIGIGGFDSFVIEREGDGWRFEAVPAIDDSFGAGDTAMFAGLLDDASSIVRVRLPGRQVEHNADRIDGDGTMIWNLDLFGEQRVLSARTEPGEPVRDRTFTPAGRDLPGSGGGGGPSAAAVIGVVVLVALAALGGWMLWRRSAGRPAPAAPVGPSSAVPAPGPAAPPPSSGPQWDPQRGAYLQWDPASGRWLQYDDVAGEWKPVPS